MTSDDSRRGFNGEMATRADVEVPPWRISQLRLASGNLHLFDIQNNVFYSRRMVFHAFPRVPGERLVCFAVANFDEVVARDPAVIERFEMEAGYHGFLAAYVDQPTNTIHVSVTDSSLTDSDVAAAVAAFGFDVQLKPKEGDPHGKAGEQFRQT